MRYVLASLAVVVLSCGVLAADAPKTDKPVDVEKVTRQALKDYKDGKVGEAIEKLQQVISEMQKSQQQGLAACFPKASANFKAGELDSQSSSSQGDKGAMTFTTISQKFTSEKDDSL